MSASIEVRISSHYVSLKKAVVTTRIRADRRVGARHQVRCQRPARARMSAQIARRNARASGNAWQLTPFGAQVLDLLRELGERLRMSASSGASTP